MDNSEWVMKVDLAYPVIRPGGQGPGKTIALIEKNYGQKVAQKYKNKVVGMGVDQKSES